MIYTGNYDNCHGPQTISISGDKGKSIEYQGDSFSCLAPKLSFWKIWHENVGVLSDRENNRHIVASWLEEELNILVPEVAISEDKIVVLETNYQVRDEYKKLILKKNR